MWKTKNWPAEPCNHQSWPKLLYIGGRTVLVPASPLVGGYWHLLQCLLYICGTVLHAAELQSDDGHACSVIERHGDRDRQTFWPPCCRALHRSSARQRRRLPAFRHR